MSRYSTLNNDPNRQGSRSPRAPSRWFSAWLILALLLTQGLGAARAEEAPEYRVKAAFLYNFAKFASWPEQSFADSSAPLQFCTLGEAPFGKALDSLEGKNVRDRSLPVRKLASVQESVGCHVLFVSEDRETQVQDVLKAVGGKPVLTVSEIEGFCERGGIINFVTLEGKVRFEINPDAAEGAGIRLSAQLLRLAKVVSGKRADR